MKKLLLTGGVGFIGHHTVEHILKNTDWHIVIMDRLSYAGNQNFLADMAIFNEKRDHVKFVFHDFRAPISEKTAELIGDLDYIIHMGAESHVDRSLEDPGLFAESNVIGTVNILEFMRKYHKYQRMVYVSTDEVYGPSIDGHLHKEGEPHKPSNPYSASKSGAEAFCYSYFNSFEMDVMITNTMNNFGERQNKEKFIPKSIKAIMDDHPVICHCKLSEAGKVLDVSSRCWLHARNHADGLLFVLANGNQGQKYNITGEKRTVEEIARLIGSYMNKEPSIRFTDFHSFRPGHDMHYGLDGTKLADMGWIPPYSLEKSLQQVVEWTLRNPQWL